MEMFAGLRLLLLYSVACVGVGRLLKEAWDVIHEQWDIISHMEYCIYSFCSLDSALRLSVDTENAINGIDLTIVAALVWAWVRSSI